MKTITTLFLATILSVTAFASGHVANASSSPATCNGTCNGTATGSVTGGVGPFGYSWSGAGTYQGTNISNLCAGTYTLTVTDSSDMSTATTSTTVSEPTPLTANIGAASSICAGSCVTLAGIVSGGTPVYTYTWLPMLSTALSPIDCPTGSTTYTLTIADMNGCVTTTTATVIVNPLDDASFSYSSNVYCQNGANPMPTITGTPGGTFTALPYTLSIIAASGGISLALSPPGTYSVKYTTSGTCPSSDSVSVTINSLPDANFAYVGSPYCQSGTPVYPTYSNGAVAGTFSATPSGIVISAFDGQITPPMTTPGTYTVTNTIGAGGGCPATSATATITIIAQQYASFAYVGSPYCQSGINTYPTYTLGGVAGTFSSTIGLVINAATGMIDLATTNPGTYTVTNTIPAGGGCPAVSATSTITINAPPIIAFSYTGNPYCQSGMYAFPTFTSGGNPIYFISSAGALVDGNTGIINLQNTPPGTYTITNIAPAGGGCPDDSATATITIIHPIANFTMVADSTNPFTYWAFNTSTGIGATYNWDFGDGSPIVSSTSPTHTYAAAGTYMVTLYDDSGSCSDSIQHQITVTGTPNTCMALFDATRTAYNSNVYTITDLSFGNNLTYMWSFGDGNTSNAPLPTYSYAGVGPYQLCLSIDDGAGCNQTFCDSLFAVDSLGHSAMQPISIVTVAGPPFGSNVTVGIHQQSMATSIDVAPNPFNDNTVFTIHSSKANKVYSFELMDVLGKSVKSIKEINEKQFTISRSGLTNGVYFYKINSADGTVGIGKLIIQ